MAPVPVAFVCRAGRALEGSRKIRRYSLALREVARSKICIDLPGNEDFCFRLIDCFAVGACVIGPKHRTNAARTFGRTQHMAYAREDVSDLVERLQVFIRRTLTPVTVGGIAGPIPCTFPYARGLEVTLQTNQAILPLRSPSVAPRHAFSAASPV